MYFACTSFGADHDGDGDAATCTDDNFIMAAVDTGIDETTTYSANPWRFSSCSVSAFKVFYQTLKNNNKYGHFCVHYISNLSTILKT